MSRQTKRLLDGDVFQKNGMTGKTIQSVHLTKLYESLSKYQDLELIALPKWKADMETQAQEALSLWNATNGECTIEHIPDKLIATLLEEKHISLHSKELIARNGEGLT
eukprot:PhF_6_TR27842/c0_g1_i1/m.40634